VSWLARVYVLPKAEVLDPQGEAILGALRHLGFAGVETVRSGRLFELRLAAPDRAAAEAMAREACERLLANTVVESYRFDLEPAPSEVGA
jgi:phosphoribosylformylglycinamidine synthase subunit PurS